MLELEEERALRKIEETRRKARTILEIRQGKTPKILRHSSPDAGTADPSLTMLFHERNEEHRRTLAERMSSIMEQRRVEATQIKKERKKLDRRKVSFERAILLDNQVRRMHVQMQAKEGLEKVERERRLKLEETWREREKEYLGEQHIVKRKSKKARRLEQREAEVLQRLKETHLQQKAAIEDIERIMKSSRSRPS